MKSLQDKQQGLRTRLRHNQREIQRLLMDYENFGLTVVNGNDVPDMDTWLVNDRPKRRAQVNHSPGPIDYTQTTDGSTQPSQPSLADSQISDAASEALGSNLFSDDYTGSSEDQEEEEERSVNTETGMPDTQASDSPYCTRAEKKKRKHKKAKKASKKAKKNNKKEGSFKDKKKGRSPPGSPSY